VIVISAVTFFFSSRGLGRSLSKFAWAISPPSLACKAFLFIPLRFTFAYSVSFQFPSRRLLFLPLVASYHPALLLMPFLPRSDAVTTFVHFSDFFPHPRSSVDLLTVPGVVQKTFLRTIHSSRRASLPFRRDFRFRA